MKDTRDQILLSLDGLNSEEMRKVLSYIKNVKEPESKTSIKGDFKRKALTEIQLALSSKIFSV